ncbi:hypothetical protein G7046_g6389 [Stylonectria norvegica]|nr:hypothetical protein G7046_g6389 [Stylonectria norvegica]
MAIAKESFAGRGMITKREESYQARVPHQYGTQKSATSMTQPNLTMASIHGGLGGGAASLASLLNLATQLCLSAPKAQSTKVMSSLISAGGRSTHDSKSPKLLHPQRELAPFGQVIASGQARGVWSAIYRI